MLQGKSLHFSAPAHTLVASLVAHTLWPVPSNTLFRPPLWPIYSISLAFGIILWVLLSSMVYSPSPISPLTWIPEFQLKPWVSHLSQREDQAIAMSSPPPHEFLIVLSAFILSSFPVPLKLLLFFCLKDKRANILYCASFLSFNNNSSFLV